MRWPASGLLILILPVAVAGAVFLVPPHLQIRAVEPALPSEAELRALARTEGGPIAIHYVESSSQESTNRAIGHSIVIMEWADGRAFMIDTGMDRQTTSEFAKIVAVKKLLDD